MLTVKQRFSISCVVCITTIHISVCSVLEAQSLKIKEEVIVSSPIVKLGDIVDTENPEIEPSLKDFPLCQSPKPGYALEIPFSTILASLHQFGINKKDVEIPPNSKSTVRRATAVISKELLAESLYHYIEENMPWDKGATTIHVYPPSSEVILPEGDIEISWNPTSTPAFIGTGIYRGKISVDGKLIKTIICRAKVEARALAVVALRTIPRGGTIKESDVTFKEIALTKNRESVLWDVASVIGAVARKSIPAGFVIGPNDVELPPVIRKNQIVPIIFEKGGVCVTGKVKVLTDAKVGEKVKCVHLDSENEVEGIVLQDGSVKVE